MRVSACESERDTNKAAKIQRHKETKRTTTERQRVVYAYLIPLSIVAV